MLESPHNESLFPERLTYFARSKMAAVLLFAVVALECLCRAFYGLNIGDAGFHIANAQSLGQFHELRGWLGLTFFSDYINGLWLCICKNIIAVRSGGLILNSLNALLSFLLLRNFFPAWKAFAAVCVCSLLIVVISPYELLIDYYSLPALFLTIIVFLCTKAVAQETTMRIRSFSIILSGVLLVLAIFARFTVIALVPVLFALLASAYWYEVHSGLRINTLRTSLRFTGGMLIGFLLMMILLWSNDWLFDYINSISFAMSKSQGNCMVEVKSATLMLNYFVRGVKAIVLAGFALFLLTFISRLDGRINRTIIYLLVVMLILAFLFVKSNGPAQGIARFREVLLGIVFLATLWLLLCGRSLPPVFRLMFVLSAVSSAAIGFGSALGLQTAVLEMWLILPVTILFMTSPILNLEGDQMVPLRTLCGPILLGLFVASVAICMVIDKSSWDFRHAVWFGSTETVSSFRAPKLKFIRTDSLRTSLVDDVYEVLKKYVSPGDTCLFLNHIGMFYWLTETRSYFDTPGMYHSREGVVEWQLDKALAHEPMPRAVVLSSHTGYSEDVRDVAFLRKVFTERFGYRQVYNDHGVEIYCPTSK